MPADPLVVAAVRSPFGLRHGQLAAWHPAILISETCAGLFASCGVEPTEVEEVIVGCATQIGAQASNLAACAAAACGCKPATATEVVSTLDTSSLTGLVRAVDSVASGRRSLVLVAGVEAMSIVPLGAEFSQRGFGRPEPQRDRLFPPSAESWARSQGLGRDDIEAVACESRSKAAAAAAEGLFAPEIVPLQAEGEIAEVTADELVNPRQANSRGIYRDCGLITASVTAPMADGAAALLLASTAATERLGIEPQARVAGGSIIGAAEPPLLSAAPCAAECALKSGGIGVGDLDRVELAEPMATSLFNWQISGLGASANRGILNPDGGSLAFGHPQGATGLGLVVRALRALRHEPGSKFALAACDASDGHAVAVLLESCL